MDSKELEAMILSLQMEITTLKEWAASEIAKHDNEIVDFKAENTALREENAKLKAKLNANSRNSSKSPSYDGFKKPAPKSLREPSRRNIGCAMPICCGNARACMRCIPNFSSSAFSLDFSGLCLRPERSA